MMVACVNSSYVCLLLRSLEIAENEGGKEILCGIWEKEESASLGLRM